MRQRHSCRVRCCCCPTVVSIDDGPKKMNIHGGKKTLQSDADWDQRVPVCISCRPLENNLTSRHTATSKRTKARRSSPRRTAGGGADRGDRTAAACRPVCCSAVTPNRGVGTRGARSAHAAASTNCGTTSFSCSTAGSQGGEPRRRLQTLLIDVFFQFKKKYCGCGLS